MAGNFRHIFLDWRSTGIQNPRRTFLNFNLHLNDSNDERLFSFKWNWKKRRDSDSTPLARRHLLLDPARKTIRANWEWEEDAKVSFHGGEEISHALKSDEKVTLDASYIPLIDAAVLFRTFSNLHNARKKNIFFPEERHLENQVRMFCCERHQFFSENMKRNILTPNLTRKTWSSPWIILFYFDILILCTLKESIKWKMNRSFDRSIW